MSLRRTVAAPFRQRGTDRIGENEFVVALSLDRDWLSPDQATRLVDVATGEGLLDREDGDLVVGFDPDSVDIPDDFVPDEELLQQRSPFEQALDRLVADGVDKQEAVAAINRLQQRLGVTIGAAAVLYARRHGLDVGHLAESARSELS